MSYQNVFERYEIKYILSAAQKKELARVLEDRMQPDQYGRTTIRNIYYDTDSFRLIRDSLDHPVYKEKLRIRSYKRADAGDMVFAEIKKKYEDVVYKRRVAIPKNVAEDWIENGKSLPFRSQITFEIDYFLKFYGDLKAKAFISYEREAFSDGNEPEFRLTLDENILARNVELDLGSNIWGQPLLEPGTTLMEVKIQGSMPLWMADFLSRNSIQKITYSKYGTYYKDHLMVDQFPERSLTYA